MEQLLLSGACVCEDVTTWAEVAKTAIIWGVVGFVGYLIFKNF